MKRLSALLLAMLSVSAAGAQPPAPQPAAPLREIPEAFRGGWDESEQGCEGFEPRFSITATALWNFEVKFVVREVRVVSPAEIEVVTEHEDHDGNRTGEEGTWRFRLVDGGRAIAGSGVDFRRCARPVSRD